MYDINIREGKSLTKNECEQIMSIWLESLGDTKDYLDMFLSVILQHIEVLTITDMNKIIGIAFSFPLTTGSGCICNYLYAGAITPSRRSEGIFRAAIDFITHIYSNNYIFAIPELIDWYSSHGYSNIYKCLEVTLDATACSIDNNINLETCDFSMDKFISLRSLYLSTLDCKYIVYPEWFLNILKADKDYCHDVMDLLSDGGEYYYVVGSYKDDELIVEETNIPLHKLTLFYSSLCYIYGVKIIKIKLPLTNQVSVKESRIIYAGQGIMPGNIWAPFPLD